MSRKYLIEMVMFLTYALFAMSWVAGSMMTKDIMAFYGLESLTSATWTTNAITLAKIIGNLLAARFLVALGIKKAFILASVLIVFGGLGIFAGHYSLYVVSRLVMGMGGALVIVYFNPIVVRYFNAEERLLINGLNAAAFNTGNIFALLLTGVLLTKLGQWQNVIMAISVASLVLLVVFCLVMEDFSLEQKDATQDQEYTLSDGLKDPVNWWLPITYSGLLFCYIAIFSLFPLVPSFAVDASKLSSVVIAAAMFGTFGGIVFSKKYAMRLPVIRFSGLITTGCAGLMIITSNPVLAYLAACGAGFFMLFPMTALVTLAQELPNMSAQRVTVIFSMFWSISYAISTLLMYIASALADYTQNVAVAAMFAAICSASFFVGSFLLPETGHTKAKTE